MAETRRFDADAIAVPDVVLTVGGKDYRISGDAVFGDDMLALAEIESELINSVGDEQIEKAADASAVLTRMVRRNTPRAPDLHFQPQQAMAVFAHLAGADSVAEAISTALRGGLVGLVDQAGIADATPDAEGGGAEDGPLPSQTPSRSPSSGSASSTGGSRSGGKKSPGARAASTSPRKRKAA